MSHSLARSSSELNFENYSPTRDIPIALHEVSTEVVVVVVVVVVAI